MTFYVFLSCCTRFPEQWCPARWAIALLETRLCVCTLCLYCYWRNKYSSSGVFFVAVILAFGESVIDLGLIGLIILKLRHILYAL